MKQSIVHVALVVRDNDDYWYDYKNMKAKGIILSREPKEEEYGTVAVFEDLFGNLYDLLELK